MTQAAILEKLEMLNRAVARLQQRAEGLEDLRDLEAATAANDSRPPIPWEQAKVDLQID